MSTIRVDNFGPSAGGTTYSARGIAKAWVNFNGTGTIAARDSENVSSLTDNGTGDYTVNFSNAFATTGYSAVVSQMRFSTTSFNDITQIEANGQLTGSVTTRTSTTTANFDPAVVSITVTGDLA